MEKDDVYYDLLAVQTVISNIFHKYDKANKGNLTKQEAHAFIEDTMAPTSTEKVRTRTFESLY